MKKTLHKKSQTHFGKGINKSPENQNLNKIGPLVIEILINQLNFTKINILTQNARSRDHNNREAKSTFFNYVLQLLVSYQKASNG